MIEREAPTVELVARHSIRGSIVSIAGRYLKSALAKGHCVECDGVGEWKCSRCDGQGLVAGEGSSSPKEPCRRCIGTGYVDCQACEAAGVLSSTPVFAH
jgi:DnaJ-class molecular chaperone